MFICPSAHPLVNHSSHFIHLPIHLSVCLTIHPSIHPSIHPPCPLVPVTFCRLAWPLAYLPTRRCQPTGTRQEIDGALCQWRLLFIRALPRLYFSFIDAINSEWLCILSQILPVSLWSLLQVHGYLGIFAEYWDQCSLLLLHGLTCSIKLYSLLVQIYCICKTAFSKVGLC